MTFHGCANVLILASLFGGSNALAAPSSEKDAFCRDRVAEIFTSRYENYEKQKAYNECMRNADQLINEYERAKERSRRMSEEALKRYKRIGEELNQRLVHPLECSQLEYPIISRRLREEGGVTMVFWLDENGRVTESMVFNSSGSHRLDLAAQSWIKECKFDITKLKNLKDDWRAIRVKFELSN